MQEVWKDVSGYDGYYQISNVGSIRSLDRQEAQTNGHPMTYKGDVMKPCKDGKGYRFVYLSRNGKRKMYKIHRIVALEFIPNPCNYEQVNHKDGNKDNNSFDNLEWCTGLYNMQHSFRNGLHKSGERVSTSILTKSQVDEIRRTHIKGDNNYGAKPLAKTYGVSDATIRNILNNKKWRVENEVCNSR